MALSNKDNIAKCFKYAKNNVKILYNMLRPKPGRYELQVRNQSLQ